MQMHGSFDVDRIYLNPGEQADGTHEPFIVIDLTNGATMYIDAEDARDLAEKIMDALGKRPAEPAYTSEGHDSPSPF